VRPIRISALLLLTGALFSCSHLDDLGEPPAPTSPSSSSSSSPSAGRPKDAGAAARQEEDEPVAKKDAGVRKADASKTTCTRDYDCISDEMSGIGCCDKPTKKCFFTEEDSCPVPTTTTTTTPTQPPYK